MIKGVSTNETGAAGVKLEGFDCEWEVFIIWVIDEEAMDYGLLKTSGLVAWGNNGATFSCSGTVFYSGSLGEMVIVDLDIVDDDSPLVAGVDGSEWSDVSCLRRTEVSFLFQVTQSVHTVVCVQISNISVKLKELVLVVGDSCFDVIFWVFVILETVGLGGVFGACWFLLVS